MIKKSCLYDFCIFNNDYECVLSGIKQQDICVLAVIPLKDFEKIKEKNINTDFKKIPKL